MRVAARFCPLLVVAALTAAVAACARQAPAPLEYLLEGQILAIDHDRHEVLIRHGDIVGFMPGMTMPFRVKPDSVLDGHVPGDLVKGTLVVSSTEAWLRALEKTGWAPLPDDAPARLPAATNVTLLQPGDLAPDDGLTAEDGSTLRLSAWRGQAVALTFIYTRCPLPQFCPLLDRRFAETQRLVAGRGDLAGRVRLLSVSFDPDWDTPAVLTAHARRLDAAPSVWRFATAPAPVVDRFAAAFGVNVVREADRTITHNMRTAVVGPDGRLIALYDGGDWTAARLVDDLARALAAALP
ncbi:MAG: SCO family protein [Acidobacteriota bacterium]